MRGAATESADLALVLVAVDAGIQPQTREVLRRCARRRQPVVFLVNKVGVLLLPAALTLTLTLTLTLALTLALALTLTLTQP